MLRWMRRLGDLGMSDADAGRVLDAATARYDTAWDAREETGRMAFKGLPWSAKWDAYRLALHVGWLSFRELLTKPRR
jgi:hypothetical protein